MDKDHSATALPAGLTIAMTGVGVEDHLAEGTPVYHRGRRQWGTVNGPSSRERGTHWVAFDDSQDSDAVQVSNELLEAAVLRRATGSESGNDADRVVVVASATGTVIGTVGAGYIVADNPPPVPAGDPEVLEVRWGIQIGREPGEWFDYSSGTWPDADKGKAQEFASSIYGGEADTRLVKIVKMVEPGWVDPFRREHG